MTTIGDQIRGEMTMIKGEIDHVIRAVEGYRRSNCFSPDSDVLLYAVLCSMERMETSLMNFETIAGEADKWHIVPQNIVTSRKKRKEAKSDGQGPEDTDSTAASAL